MQGLKVENIQSKRIVRPVGLLPLTVKQANQALQHPSGNTFIVDGVDTNIVTLVGMVTGKEENTIDVSFSLDDPTGRIDVKCWLKGAHACEEILSIQDGKYVRIHGRLKGIRGNKS
ncbi:hypothetical protein KP509_36G051600 [Ceratopteris richardii]|uniref:OB domain-containing protein n=1 Tax=Ceratopteris richardii TaxID=49495 RepID=A0A8T2QBM0_CERRI|nr:hypothetical protein KP509_36G051600 [Ceratopteris richardii]KAH7281517.1 hypothetical protein KP509_36G051600 [Ceratopteris richardii]